MNFFNYRWDYLNSSHLFSYTCCRYHLGTTFRSFLLFLCEYIKKNYFQKLAVSENADKIYSCYSLFSFSYAAASIPTFMLLLTRQSSLFDQTLLQDTNYLSFQVTPSPLVLHKLSVMQMSLVLFCCFYKTTLALAIFVGNVNSWWSSMNQRFDSFGNLQAIENHLGNDSQCRTREGIW